MREQIAAGLADALVTARALVKTRMLDRLKPRALPVLLRQRASGSAGPSSLFRLNAAAKPNGEAFVWSGHRLDWTEADRRVDRIAAGLRERHGLAKGDSVVLMMHNTGAIVEIQAAMSRIGGGTVPISYRSRPEEVDYLVNHCGARAVFVGADLADVLLDARAALTSVPDENLIVVGGARNGFVPYEDLLRGDHPSEADSDEAGAVVIYTSGTTGRPKGAVRRFPKEMQAAVLRFILETPIRGDDRHLAVCPMYHSTAFGFIGFTMAVGGTVVISERFDPEGFLALVEHERITTTAVVPTMMHRILELPDATIDRYDTRSLRAVFSGGSALSGTLARRFMERFGHVIYNFYGATETGINTVATPEELLRSPGTIGHLVPGNEIRLLDDDGNQVSEGQTGELHVRNAWLVAGYHKNAAATQQSMTDGFFSVGDLAHCDEHGLFHIDGRKRDMIISGGVNVYPAEVEEVLTRHPAIAEAAVVGVADEEWGERVRAFVAFREGRAAAPEELIAWTRDKLSGPKVPREVVVMDRLPKNPTGKVLKRELRTRD